VLILGFRAEAASTRNGKPRLVLGARRAGILGTVVYLGRP
jgi:hypothetical protein